MNELPTWVREILLASPNVTKENEIIVTQVDAKTFGARWKDQPAQFELDILWEIDKTNRAK
jgi:hypothetical protein